MEYLVKLISKNRPGTRLNAKGIVLHETATPGADAEREYLYFNRNNVKASAHAFVDNKCVIQTIPYDEMAWHAGKTANSNYIGIEMCRPKNYDEDYFNAMYQNTVSLFADLFVNQLGIHEVTSGNLMTHAEVSAKWRETDHTDPNAYFKEYGKTIDGFRKDVQRKIDEGEIDMAKLEELENRIAKLENKMVYNYIDTNMPDWAKPTIQKLVDKGYLKGDGNGLGLTDEMLKIFVILDRAGDFE